MDRKLTGFGRTRSDMKLLSLQTLKGLFSSTGGESSSQSTMGSGDYNSSEIDCLKYEIKANSEKARAEAQQRGYRRNERAAKLA